jgi:hypothetical protein
MRKVLTYIAVLAIAFSMLYVPTYAAPNNDPNYSYVDNETFFQYLTYYNKSGHTFINGSVWQGYTAEQTAAIQAKYASFNLTGNVATQWDYYNGDSNPPLLKMWHFTSNDSPFTIEKNNTTNHYELRNYSGSFTGYKIYPNGSVTTGGIYSFTLNLTSSTNPQTVSYWNMGGGYIENEASVTQFPVNSVNKYINVPSGYAVSFYRKSNLVYESTGFTFYTDHVTGVPVLADEITKGTYYKTQTGYPAGSQLSFSNSLPQLNWVIIKNSNGTVRELSTNYEADLDSGETITFYNPYNYFYAPTKAIQNGYMRVSYSSNAYSAKLYAVTTSDQNGFVIDGLAETTYQPYNPLPSDTSDNEVEIVDSSSPGYIDTTNPEYEEPDTSDPEYEEPPYIPPITPPTGGGLGGQPPGTYVPSEDDSFIDIIKQTVNGLAENIRMIFQPAIGAIQSMIASGTSFMQAVGQMFTWLPIELQQVIVSALILLIVIGVVKLLV